jgi:hypothetical protein
MQMTPIEIPEGNQDQWREIIAKLNYNQLHEIRVHINERMKAMRENGVEQLRFKFIEEAAALGLAPEDIFGAPKKQRRKRRKKEDEANDSLA